MKWDLIEKAVKSSILSSEQNCRSQSEKGSYQYTFIQLAPQTTRIKFIPLLGSLLLNSNYMPRWKTFVTIIPRSFRLKAQIMDRTFQKQQMKQMLHLLRSQQKGSNEGFQTWKLVWLSALVKLKQLLVPWNPVVSVIHYQELYLSTSNMISESFLRFNWVHTVRMSTN